MGIIEIDIGLFLNCVIFSMNPIFWVDSELILNCFFVSKLRKGGHKESVAPCLFNIPSFNCLSLATPSPSLCPF